MEPKRVISPWVCRAFYCYFFINLAFDYEKFRKDNLVLIFIFTFSRILVVLFSDQIYSQYLLYYRYWHEKIISQVPIFVNINNLFICPSVYFKTSFYRFFSTSENFSLVVKDTQIDYYTTNHLLGANLILYYTNVFFTTS